ncbi:MAG: aldose 1-epimerase family protein [Bacteroidetes bacterium]|nr:aldose 1-epimerase family protein [Bacteroidota bacterium]
MEEILSITSGDFTASFKSFGAELISVFHNKSKHEFIWQANNEIWGRHAPVLFPFVGRLNNFEYIFNGKIYKIEQHGFARDLQFTINAKGDDFIIFELSKNEYTYQRYPFDFNLKIHYKLSGNKLMMEFIIANLSISAMPVSFGGHPGFKISDPDDAIIEFENDADPDSLRLLSNFVSLKTRKVTNGNGIINIDQNTFNNDALIFKNLKSKYVILKSKSSSKTVKVKIEGWKYLGIWSKPGADFICIEPWEGIADYINFKNDVSVKEGIITLKPFEILKKSFSMEFGV